MEQTPVLYRTKSSRTTMPSDISPADVCKILVAELDEKDIEECINGKALLKYDYHV